MFKKPVLSVLTTLVACSTWAGDAPQGTTTLFTSPNGVQEACVAVPEVPGGNYSKKDREQAEKLCSTDLYDSANIALCPKTWSTSPAVMVYNITKLNTTAQDYEAGHCKGKSDKPEGVKTAFKIKTTMNQKNTSATYSPSAQVYYHLSRYFDTAVGVPVAVYRELDPQVHLERVARTGKARAAGDMNRAAWSVMIAAGEDANSYKPTMDLFTSDLTKYYGMASKDVGEGYGDEINGTRSGGYKTMAQGFQEVPAFRALRAEGNLNEAIAKGLSDAKAQKTIAKNIGNVSEFQMLYWMREISEITLLDFILNQQDRAENIDFEWKWYWVENGEVQDRDADSEVAREKMGTIAVPEDIAAFNPELIQRSHIGDNDAGTYNIYSNINRLYGVINNFRHYSAKTYTRLINLNNDLQSQGPVYQYLAANFNLKEKDLQEIADNTAEAAKIMKAQCDAGKLRFDLDNPKSFLLNGDQSVALDCANPVFE